MRTTLYLETLGPFYADALDAETWNGWACPYFGRTEAERIMERMVEEGEYRSWRYDPAQDAFIGVIDDHNEDVFIGEARGYPIGAFAWTWSTGE